MACARHDPKFLQQVVILAHNDIITVLLSKDGDVPIAQYCAASQLPILSEVAIFTRLSPGISTRDISLIDRCASHVPVYKILYCQILNPD